MISASAVVLRGRLLPRWVNWLGLVGGVSYAVPVVTFGADGFRPALGGVAAFGFLFHTVWMIALDVCIFRRGRRADAAPLVASSPPSVSNHSPRPEGRAGRDHDAPGR